MDKENFYIEIYFVFFFLVSEKLRVGEKLFKYLEWKNNKLI